MPEQLHFTVPADYDQKQSHLLIADKPPFMPVHPVKQYQTDTLANRVAAYSLNRGERYVFRAVNRLDRNTSGLVMIAKDRFTVNRLKNNLPCRRTRRNDAGRHRQRSHRLA